MMFERKQLTVYVYFIQIPFYRSLSMKNISMKITLLRELKSLGEKGHTLTSSMRYGQLQAILVSAAKI